jgi:hypothetical protein
MLRRLGSDVEPLKAVGNLSSFDDKLLAIGAEIVATMRVDRQPQR